MSMSINRKTKVPKKDNKTGDLVYDRNGDIQMELKPKNTKRQFNLLPSMTKQEFAKECDINTILDKYRKNGILPQGRTVEGVYDDFSDGLSFQDMQFIITDANQAFMSLDSKTRKTFDNSPQRLLEALNDPSQREKLENLGILSKKAIEAPEEPVEPPTEPAGEGA